MPTAPFPVDPVLTAIALAYRNPMLIADGVFPRVPVGKEEFKYFSYPKGGAFTIPDTQVGRKSQPNEIEVTATEVTDSTEDYGLEDPIPQADIANAPPNYNPLGRATERLTDLILLDREVRAAALAFAAGNYAAANKVTLSGTDQWSDEASDPIADILAGLDACIMRPNVMVIGRGAFTALIKNPVICKAVHGNAGDSGVARRQQVAELFELEEILVGEGWVNASKKGQTVSLTRVWGKHAALIHRNKQADTSGGVTFGFTAEFGSRVSGSVEDRNIGLRGGQRVRVGESVKELMVANDLGYLIVDAAA